TPEESTEKRGAAKENPVARNTRRTLRRESVPTYLRRVGPASRQGALRCPLIRGGSPVREIRPPGSVRGAPRKGGPYRNSPLPQPLLEKPDRMPEGEHLIGSLREAVAFVGEDDELCRDPLLLQGFVELERLADGDARIRRAL